MRDVKEVHIAVCRHLPSAYLCEKKAGGGAVWTYESEVSSPTYQTVSALGAGGGAGRPMLPRKERMCDSLGSHGGCL